MVILLQGALAFGILLNDIAKALFFIGVPLLTVISTYRTISRERQANPAGFISTKEIVITALEKFFYALFIVFIFGIIILVFLFLLIDLSDS